LTDAVLALDKRCHGVIRCTTPKSYGKLKLFFLFISVTFSNPPAN
jgi:hypothetical protein